MGVLDGIGAYFILLYRSVAKPEKYSMYWREILRQMNDIGVGSFGIIAIVAVFIGAVTAVQFSIKLLAIGTIPMWWMGGIVRDSTVLELAPTISALLLAGKVGSNIASELGTMRISEQIDAMEIMGVNTRSYLIMPKIIGSMVIVPPLVITAMFLGIIGGLYAGTWGGFFTQEEYIRGLQDQFNPYYLTVLMIKSVVFGFLIASISCYKGYNVKGGALELGTASTDAVVMSSIAIIISNFIIAFVLL
ncbi:MAG: ABC transporter permease [Bacteroidetes bacterium]|nr:ABC transporter permease [Bacteroidota bacterium]MBP7478120.1 ABC transporter permease [Chitinophagales bacterium]